METNNLEGLYSNTRNILYGSALREWLEKDVLPNYSDNTYDQYLYVANNHLSPEFGKMFIGKFSPSILNAKFLFLRDKGYSRSTVLLVYNIIRSSFRWCISNKYITREESPLDGLKMPRYRGHLKEVDIFTEKEIQKIFERFSKGTYLYLPCMLAYGTGMRAGEILGLTWDKIDLKKRTILISTTLYDKKNMFKLEPQPKSISSIRKIAFSEKIYEAFMSQKERQTKKPSSFVCTNKQGKPMTSNNLRYFNLWCKENLGHGTFHVFRHTHATMLIDNDVQLDYVAKRLGHSNTSITANNYIRITDKRNKNVMDKLDDLL